MNKLSNVDAAYLAGLVDGEGTISLSRKNASSVYKYPSLSITNTDKLLINWCYTITAAGRIQKRKRRKPHHKDGYVWECRHSASTLIKQIYPYLKEVRKKRVLSLYWVNIKRSHPVTENIQRLYKKKKKHLRLNFLRRSFINL